MIGMYPLAALGPRNLQALSLVRPVAPVVRGSGNASAPASAPDNKDRVTLRGDSVRASDGLYTRKGTLSSSVESKQSFDMAIKTTEGDIAILHFSQSAGTSTTINAESSRRGGSVETLQESHGALDLQVITKGTFSDEENQAIDQLMQQASQVADQFFAGDLEAANTQAGKLQLAGDALQSFSMNLRSQEMRHVSATYEEVARFTAPAKQPMAPAPPTPPSSDRMPGTDLLQGLKQLLAQLVADVKDPKVVTDAVDKTALAQA